MKHLALLLCGLLVPVSGCIGFFFGPGFSCTDTIYFAAPPVVVKKGEQYVLRWRYGSMGFFYRPRYEAREGALWFSLQATSSSGSVAGKEVEMLIEGQKEIAALKDGGAIWWASDGSRVPPTIKEEPNKSPEPTPTAVTPRAIEMKTEEDPSKPHSSDARGAPAAVVAHL